jgi:PAS domain-containing protein
LWRIIAGIFGNALERKYAEEAVRERRNRLNNIIESAMDAIIVVDSQQRIVVFNAAAEKLFGYPEAEVLGQPLERLIPHRFRARDYVSLIFIFIFIVHLSFSLF